jgi:hypothetical protein
MKNILFVAVLVLICAAFSQRMMNTAPVKKHIDPHAFYLSDIAPIMETKCAPCHIPAKGGFKTSFDNYDSAAKYIDAMLVRVQLDSMDPKYMPFRRKRAAVTDVELNAMKAWKDSLAVNR